MTKGPDGAEDDMKTYKARAEAVRTALYPGDMALQSLPFRRTDKPDGGLGRGTGGQRTLEYYGNTGILCIYQVNQNHIYQLVRLKAE